MNASAVKITERLFLGLMTHSLATAVLVVGLFGGLLYAIWTITHSTRVLESQFIVADVVRPSTVVPKHGELAAPVFELRVLGGESSRAVFDDVEEAQLRFQNGALWTKVDVRVLDGPTASGKGFDIYRVEPLDQDSMAALVERGAAEDAAGVALLNMEVRVRRDTLWAATVRVM